jgi:hypothetical protein
LFKKDGVTSDQLCEAISLYFDLPISKDYVPFQFPKSEKLALLFVELVIQIQAFQIFEAPPPFLKEYIEGALFPFYQDIRRSTVMI